MPRYTLVYRRTRDDDDRKKYVRTTIGADSFGHAEHQAGQWAICPPGYDLVSITSTPDDCGVCGGSGIACCEFGQAIQAAA